MRCSVNGWRRKVRRGRCCVRPTRQLLPPHLDSVFDGQRRSVTGTEFVEELNPLLVELREEGFDLPRNAVGYISDWVKAGFLIRRSPQGMQEEFYELSTDAITALDYISVLLKPRKSATRSRFEHGRGTPDQSGHRHRP